MVVGKHILRAGDLLYTGKLNSLLAASSCGLLLTYTVPLDGPQGH